LRRTEGAELAELAMVLPIMLTILIGIFQFGRAYNVYAALNSAALEGAKAASLSSCATCGNVASTPNQIALGAVAPILQANHLSLSAVSAGPCSNPGDVVSTVAPAICVNQNAVNGVNIVRLVYPYNFGLPIGSFALQIRASAQSVTN
jgi:Flp pilus assembly protein TadG